MSTNLFMKIPSNPAGLTDRLKHAFRRKYDEPQGINRHVLKETDIEYLKGVKDAGIDEASFLIDSIRDNGRIEIYEE